MLLVVLTAAMSFSPWPAWADPSEFPEFAENTSGQYTPVLVHIEELGCDRNRRRTAIMTCAAKKFHEFMFWARSRIAGRVQGILRAFRGPPVVLY